MARNRSRLVFQKGADLLKEPIGSLSDTPGTNGFKRERRRTGRGNAGTRQGQNRCAYVISFRETPEAHLRALDDYCFEGPLRDDFRFVAASGRVLHEPGVPWVESGGIACAGSDSNASG